MSIHEVIGQKEVWGRLMQMVEENRIPHALLFCGPRGCGKMATALAFASYLMGERDEANLAPGESLSDELRRAKAMLKKWEHPDLHFTYPTIKTSDMPSDHKPVSDDFATQWREMLAKGPYFQIDEWMRRIGKTDTDLNKQAIITAEEADDISHKLNFKSNQGRY